MVALSNKGHVNIVQFLLAKGADVNLIGGEYGCALQAASAKGHDSIVQLLLAKGAYVNLTAGKYGYCWYHYGGDTKHFHEVISVQFF